ncbi:MAG TPA: hypothetical protein VEY33_02845 [Gemmatimonadota bacterium]|nr:hypothetical protein [Gemmatimonadota bacterium]
MSGWVAAWALVAGLALATISGPVTALGQEAASEQAGAFRLLVVEAPGGRLVVFHHVPADSAIVALLAEKGGSFVPLPVASLNLPPDTFDVVVAPTEAAFRELTSGRAPDWGLAVAFPRVRRVVMRSPKITGKVDVDPAIVLRHELAHLYLGAALNDDGERLPRWFNEGFAALYADEWRWVDPYRLAWARVTGTLAPLGELNETFPQAPDPSLAYTQSMAAVRGLERRGGDAALGHLLSRMREGATFDQAMRGTYGLTLDQFYGEWESELGRQYGWTVALTGQQGLWIALALLVLVLYGIRRRAVRQEIERRIRSEDKALGKPDDHSLGVEEWERYWEWDDESWKGEGEEE